MATNIQFFTWVRLFSLCSTCVHLCSICVPFVFHLCSICVPFVFHLCSTCVHLCSLVFYFCSLVFIRVPLVFICVHLLYLCSLEFIRVPLVFICVHLCSLVILVFTCVHSCSTCVHLCSLVFLLMWCFRLDRFLVICIHKASINYVNDQEGCPCFLMNHFIHLDYRLLIAVSQVETIKLYKLLNTAEKLKYNHRKKSFNWCN